MSWKIPTEWQEELSRHPAPRVAGLGPRLSAVALSIPRGSVVADIGADHGLLSHALLRARHARFVYATDASEAALSGARTLLARYVEQGHAAALHGDGFAAAPPGSVDCAVLAGTGSGTAIDIVRRGLAAGHQPRRIVFQPSGGEHDVRAQMLNLGYGLVAERLVAEGRRLFMVLVFEHSTGVRSLEGPLDHFVGPFIKALRGPTLSAWLDGQLSWLRGLVEQAKTPEDLSELRDRLNSIATLRAGPG